MRDALEVEGFAGGHRTQRGDHVSARIALRVEDEEPHAQLLGTEPVDAALEDPADFLIYFAAAGRLTKKGPSDPHAHAAASR
mgnify:CR=1 FL=1